MNQSDFDKKWLYEPLNAYNVLEFDIPESELDKVNSYYLKEIQPNLQNEKTEEGFTGGLYCEIGDRDEEDCWFIMETKWNSDLKWVSVNNLKTYEKWSKLFYEFKFDKVFDNLIDYDKKINIYSIFIVTRSEGVSHDFHIDWFGPANGNAFTSMAPIQTCREDTINLDYKDVDGNQRQYKYEKGKSVAFSEGFLHSTGVGKSETPDAFLCFSFGSDKPEYQETNQKTGAYQGKRYMDPQKGWSLTKLNEDWSNKDVGS
tara:strand:+ start:10391 stop:11164 length:774 start_codon:yes stop_codon:yes gene_type:complete